MNGKKPRSNGNSKGLVIVTLAITNLLLLFYISVFTTTSSPNDNHLASYHGDDDTARPPPRNLNSPTITTADEEPIDIDPIAEYANNIDLMKVPPKGSPPNLIADKAQGNEMQIGEEERKSVGYGG